MQFIKYSFRQQGTQEWDALTKTKYAHYPINCEISAGGYFVCENVSSLQMNVRNALIYKINVLGINVLGSPFKTLDVLATDLVVENMSYLVR